MMSTPFSDEGLMRLEELREATYQLQIARERLQARMFLRLLVTEARERYWPTIEPEPEPADKDTFRTRGAARHDFNRMSESGGGSVQDVR